MNELSCVPIKLYLWTFTFHDFHTIKSSFFFPKTILECKKHFIFSSKVIWKQIMGWILPMACVNIYGMLIPGLEGEIAWRKCFFIFLTWAVSLKEKKGALRWLFLVTHKHMLLYSLSLSPSLTHVHTHTSMALPIIPHREDKKSYRPPPALTWNLYYHSSRSSSSIPTSLTSCHRPSYVFTSHLSRSSWSPCLHQPHL